MTEQVRDIHDLTTAGTVVKPEKLLNAEDKEALAEDGRNFIVNSINTGDDKQYGPYWEVKATLDGEPISFRLSQHDRRDAFMQSLEAALDAGPISGLRLQAVPAAGGNAFVWLEPS